MGQERSQRFIRSQSKFNVKRVAVISHMTDSQVTDNHVMTEEKKNKTKEKFRL